MATTAKYDFKAPAKSSAAAAWWDGAKRGQLVLQHCNDCEAITHPPNAVCTTCLSTDQRYEPASGLGEVYTYTVTTRPMHEEFVLDAPYLIAYVRLDEGVTIVSWLRDVEPSPVLIGQRVRAVFERIGDDTYLHRFVPAAE
jgi:uncharacterized protein